LSDVADGERVGWMARVMLVVEDEAVGFIVLLTIVDENVGWRSMVMLGNWMV
jgi:hypothetical protein